MNVNCRFQELSKVGTYKVLNSIWHRFNDLPQESIIVTNGATEAIYLLAHLFEGKIGKYNIPAVKRLSERRPHTISISIPIMILVRC